MVDDVDLRLADADGLEVDVVAAGRVHEQRGLQRRLAQPAERAAVGHAADEDAGVEEVLGQADAVAEQRALRERGARVDGEDGDAAVGGAAPGDERADERRLARAGRAGDADDGGVAGLRIDLADELPAARIVVLDERDPARERAAVAAEESLREGALLRHPRIMASGRRFALAESDEGVDLLAQLQEPGERLGLELVAGPRQVDLDLRR